MKGFKVLTAIMFCSALALILCLTPAEAKEPIRIGAIVELTGSFDLDKVAVFESAGNMIVGVPHHSVPWNACVY